MSWTRCLPLLLLPLFLLPASASTARYLEIDAPGVKRLVDGGNALLVNPMTPIEFDNEHIPGSENIPIETLAARLPKDKQTPLVFYCLGQKCVYSWRAADEALALGYTVVHVFRGGIPEWKAAGYATVSTARLPDVEVRTVTTAKLARMLDSEEMVLLDISSEKDARKFWIDTPKRVHISLHDLKARYTVLPKNKKIVIMCLRGQRGATAVRFLASRGFSNLQMLEGGLEKWVFEGRPARRGL